MIVTTSVNIQDAMKASPRLHLVMRELGVRKAHELMWPKGHVLHADDDDIAWKMRRDLEGRRIYDHEHKSWTEAVKDDNGEVIGQMRMHTCPNNGLECTYDTVGGHLRKRLRYVDSVIEWAAAMHEKVKSETLRAEDSAAYTAWKQSGEVLVQLKVQRELEEIAWLEDSLEWHKKRLKEFCPGLPQAVTDGTKQGIKVLRDLLAKRSVRRAQREAELDAEHLLDIAMSHARAEREWRVDGSIDSREEAFLNGQVLGVIQEQDYYESVGLRNRADADLAEDDQNDIMRAPTGIFINWTVRVGKDVTVKVPVKRPSWLKFPDELEEEFIEGGMSEDSAISAAEAEFKSICEVMRILAYKQAKTLNMV